MIRVHPAALALAISVAACKSEPPKMAATSTPAIPTPHTIVVHAKDFAFNAPDTVPAGVAWITLANDGPGLHHVQLVKLDSGKTAADLGNALKKPGPFPAWAKFASGPNAAMPGGHSIATVDLAAGNYAIICLVDVPDRIPHFAKGMIRPLTVVADTGAASAMPKGNITLTLTEYAFQPSDTIRATHEVFDVVNAGAQPHEVVLVKFLPGKGMKDLQAWAADYKGPPPIVVLGGVTATPPGMPVQFAADITPGDYAFVCFIPDVKDGKPHIEHGMVTPFTVK